MLDIFFCKYQHRAYFLHYKANSGITAGRPVESHSGARGKHSRGAHDFHGEREAQACNGGLGAVPPACVQGSEPPVGVRGAKPPEAECFFAFACPKEAANLTNSNPIQSNAFISSNEAHMKQKHTHTHMCMPAMPHYSAKSRLHVLNELSLGS